MRPEALTASTGPPVTPISSLFFPVVIVPLCLQASGSQKGTFLLQNCLPGRLRWGLEISPSTRSLGVSAAGGHLYFDPYRPYTSEGRRPGCAPPPLSLQPATCPSELPTVGDCEVFGCLGLFECALFPGWSLVYFLSLSCDHSASPFSSPTGTGRNHRHHPPIPQLLPGPVPHRPLSPTGQSQCPKPGGREEPRTEPGRLAHTQALGSREKQVNWGEGSKGRLTVLYF